MEIILPKKLHKFLNSLSKYENSIDQYITNWSKFLIVLSFIIGFGIQCSHSYVFTISYITIKNLRTWGFAFLNNDFITAANPSLYIIYILYCVSLLHLYPPFMACICLSITTLMKYLQTKLMKSISNNGIHKEGNFGKFSEEFKDISKFIKDLNDLKSMQFAWILVIYINNFICYLYLIIFYTGFELSNARFFT